MTVLLDMSTTVKSRKSRRQEIQVARRLSPEDISRGDTVVISEVQYEFPSFFWCDADPIRLPMERPVRITFRACHNPEPMRVKEICLPYVLCYGLKGDFRVVDVRQVQLMRLSADFASAAQKAFKAKQKPKPR